jgi:hypothetical protein
MLTAVLSTLNKPTRPKVHPERIINVSSVLKELHTNVKDPCVKIYAKCQEKGAYEQYKKELTAIRE